MIEFYGNWLFYGGMLGVLSTMVAAYAYGKKHDGKIGWKPSLLILSICMFPTVMLPLLLAPGVSKLGKAILCSALILFAIVRYVFSTMVQDALNKLRRKYNK